MLRWLTAGESHGPELVAIIEGMPAGVALTTENVQDALARRRLGFGRGARMKFEKDEVSLSSGVRHGFTQGGPIAITIQNTEWPKWEKIMSADPVEASEISGARAEKLTRPRPGHADFTGMQKFGFDDSRPVLERASARETAARVALGEVAARFLGELGIDLVTHTVAIGTVSTSSESVPRQSDVEYLDNDPVRIYRKIYDSMYESLKPESIPQAVVTLARYQYQAAFVADQEINLVACLTEFMVDLEFK